ncbi:MAG: hypothetical protein KDD56_00125 [Bdellovibrionales bacterium]|nr:hypothetical protein [Bdellovibrionales bacterium]
MFRSADAFGVKEVHLIGINFFDPGPAVGSFKWVPAKFKKSFSETYSDLIEQDYTIFALEPVGGELLTEVTLPSKSAFILGHEQFGLSFDPKMFPKVKLITIPQFGKVQSLNVSVAASLVLYEYLKQHISGKEIISNFQIDQNDDRYKKFI